jgi:integrase
VISIYVADRPPAGPGIGRFERLVEFFGRRFLSEVNGALCREYAAWRNGKGQSNKGKGGGARRDLEDLRAAINHHSKEGLHRGVVRVSLPERGTARQRWLTRPEMARLLWACWRNKGPAGEWASRHLVRFLIMGIYTGSRPGAILTAAWDRGPGRSWVDLDRGVFHRHPDGKAETNKRQPTVKISPRLGAHLRRWRAADGGRGYVVTYEGHRLLAPTDALARAVTRAGLEGGVTAYTMRHSCASWLVAKGVPTKKVADFLGTSEEMIHRHYGHLAPDYQDEAATEIGRK